jgi:uncharacterized protein (UPF0332 family)
MSFDWTEYLKLAEELVAQTAGQSSEEARQRCAISRAYYAAFKTAFTFLCQEIQYFQFEKEGVHEKVRQKFKDRDDQTSVRISENLLRLSLDRNKADYVPEVDALPGTVAKALIVAQSVIDDLKTLR